MSASTSAPPEATRSPGPALRQLPGCADTDRAGRLERVAPGGAGRDGARHRWLERWCELLERMWLAQCAQALLARPEELPEGAATVFVAPMWLWRRAALDVGRKARAADGGTLLMPVRLDWSPAPVLVIEPGQRATLSWTADGLGWRGQGSTGVTGTDPGAAPGPSQDWAEARRRPGGPTAAVAAHAGRRGVSAGEVTRVLAGLVEDGRVARWSAVQRVEPLVRANLARANTYLSHDVCMGGDHHPRPLVGEVTLDTVHDRLMFGDQGEDSFVFRLLRRCLQVDTFTKVDPLRWLTATIRREAQQTLRGVLGDPHVGSKIRRAARELGDADTVAVLAAYRARHPRDMVGPARVKAALSVAPDPSAAAVHLREGQAPGGSR